MDTNYQNKQYNMNQIWLKYLQRMDTNRLPKQAIHYKQKWLKHVQRMDTNRLQNKALKYKPKVAKICKEDGHKQTTNTSTTI